MNRTNYVGKKYRVESVEFEILDVEEYPTTKVSEEYKEVLKFRSGYLVAISYRGTLIPNITLEDGVIRITKIMINKQIQNRPGAISSALGITETMYAYDIFEV